MPLWQQNGVLDAMEHQPEKALRLEKTLAA